MTHPPLTHRLSQVKHTLPPRAFLHRRRGGEERLQTIWISFNWVPREGRGQLFLHDAFLPKRAFLLCATRGVQLSMRLKRIASFVICLGNVDINARAIVWKCLTLCLKGFVCDSHLLILINLFICGRQTKEKKKGKVTGSNVEFLWIILFYLSHILVECLHYRAFIIY